jgi:hypothetical protein
MTSLPAAERRSGGASRPERLGGHHRPVPPSLLDDQPALARAETPPDVVSGQGDSDRSCVSWHFRHPDILTQGRIRPLPVLP